MKWALKFFISFLSLTAADASFSHTTGSSSSRRPADTFPTPDGMLSRYESAVRTLYQVNMWSPVKLGLENSETLHRPVGSPMKRIPVVHIAGTNGKGSTVHALEALARAHGIIIYSGYNPPHLKNRIMQNSLSKTVFALPKASFPI